MVGKRQVNTATPSSRGLVTRGEKAHLKRALEDTKMLCVVAPQFVAGFGIKNLDLEQTQ